MSIPMHIQLKNSPRSITVDEDAYDELTQYEWSVVSRENGKAVIRSGAMPITRILFPEGNPRCIRRIGDLYDCRRSNFRVGTKKEKLPVFGNPDLNARQARIATRRWSELSDRPRRTRPSLQQREYEKREAKTDVQIVLLRYGIQPVQKSDPTPTYRVG